MGIRIGGGGTGRPGCSSLCTQRPRLQRWRSAAGAGRSGGGGGEQGDAEEGRRRGGAGARKLGEGRWGRSCWEGESVGRSCWGGRRELGKEGGGGGWVYGGGSPEHRRVSGRLSDRCCGAWWGSTYPCPLLAPPSPDVFAQTGPPTSPASSRGHSRKHSLAQ